MIALQKQWTLFDFLSDPRCPGRVLHLDILVNHLTVEDNLDETGMGSLLAIPVEARGAERNIERLPLAGFLARVDARRGALVDVVVARFLVGARVDAAAVAPGQLCLAETILNLDLVKAIELDA